MPNRTGRTSIRQLGCLVNQIVKRADFSLHVFRGDRHPNRRVIPHFEFLCVLCGLSFANFAVKGSCSRPKSKDSNRKAREEKAEKCAKKFKLSHYHPPSLLVCKLRSS